MKKMFVFIFLSILIFVIACNEDQPTKLELQKIDCISDSMTINCIPNEIINGGQNSSTIIIKPYYAYSLTDNGCFLSGDTVIVGNPEIDTMYAKDIIVMNWDDITVLELFHSLKNDTLQCFKVITNPFDSTVYIYKIYTKN